MPTESMSGKSSGMVCRFDAYVDPSTYKLLKSMKSDDDKNLGLLISRLWNECMAKGFEGAFRKSQNNMSSKGRGTVNHQLNMLKTRMFAETLIGKYKDDEIRREVAEEVKSFIEGLYGTEEAVEPILVDTMISKGCDSFLKRMSKEFGRNASKAKVLSTMVHFIHEEAEKQIS